MCIVHVLLTGQKMRIIDVYKRQDKKLFTIGITGTKGKTTTTYMIKNVLCACGIKTGLIGTIETVIGDETIPSCNTTPESLQTVSYTHLGNHP